MQILLKMERVVLQDPVSISVDDYEIAVADSEEDASSSTSPGRFRFLTDKGMVALDEGSRWHGTIMNNFGKGMGLFRNLTEVVAIHGNSYIGSIGEARLKAFKIFSEAVAKKCGGNANVKPAWYGASREEVIEIVTHGFSRCRESETSASYGFGVCLSAADFSIEAVVSSLADDNGLRHVLLCGVILGKMEVVSAGSKQFQPSSVEFDSGVDELSKPRRYIIWGAYMNSHILPT